MTNRDSIAALLARHSYEEGEFRLSSGKTTDFYLDAKQVTYRPEGASLIGQEVLTLVQDHGIQAVGGLTMGADAIVASTVCASVALNKPIPGFVVRKKPKEYGLGKWIEGVNPIGMRVAIVDDVVTSGRSILEAVRRSEEAGARVVAIVALVDREEGGTANLRATTGVPVYAICTLTEVRNALRVSYAAA